MKPCTYLLLVLVAALAGCGTPGAPQPPSLLLPHPAADLVASRKGGKVTLTWTPARQTTDGVNIKQPATARVCRSTIQFPMAECEQPVVEVPVPPPSADVAKLPRLSAVDDLPAALTQGSSPGFAAYAVEAVNARGRSAGLSNQVRVPLLPVLPPPSDLQGQVTADGVVLTWTAAPPPHPNFQYIYRIYRRAEDGATDSVTGELPLSQDAHASLTDRTFEWEKTYSYRVTTVTRSDPETAVEGDDSLPIRVFAHDVFPPAIPQGLQAVEAGVGQQPFIDLTWSPNTESDLAGYNVYRSEAGSKPVSISSSLVKTPSFRDPNVVPGHKYTYSVSAVDVRGNESIRSDEATEPVPEK